MATKPKAILSTHDGRETSPITKASNVLFENEQTAQDILNDRQDAMISPVIENSSSMFKVGQGDDVDYSANVVNGAYESMVLKGKSMVNCIQEPSSKDIVLPYEFADGQYVTINDTKESGALGVELKGQTLVNIHKSATYSLSRQNEGWYENLVAETNRISFEVTDTSTDGWRYLNLGKLNLDMLKPNTKYLVYFGVANFPHNLGVRFMNGNATDKISNEAMVAQGSNWAILTTSSEIIKSEQVLYVSFTNVLGKVEVGNAMIFEYQEGMENWDIPYIEGITSCKMPILNSVNQLFDYSCATKPTNTGTISFANDGRTLKTDFDVVRDCVDVTNITLPAGTYDISYKVRGAVTLPDGADFSSRVGMTFFKSSEIWSNCALSITTHFSSMSATKYTEAKKTINVTEPVTVTIIYHAWANQPVGWCEFKDIRIIPQGKSSILSLPEEVVLRSLPNGVCDTFNTRTGVYTQRVYETTITGTEDWIQYDASNTNRQETIAFSVNLGLGEVFDNDKTYSRLGGVICDKLNHINSVWGNDKDIEGISADQRNVIVQIKKTRLASEDVAGFKTWLTSNNLKVGIQLKVPTITKINLPSTLKSWNTTTHIYSEIPENTLYPILSHSNPTYPVILKPSTKYSIVANSYSNSHTNSPINFNLGGATASTTVGNRVTTITTPSTLSNELLTMSGRGNKLNHVMVIEGEVVDDEPYFEGICDCKSPILSNVGKNLFNIDGKFVKGAYSYGIPLLNSSNQVIEKIGENSLHITCGTNFYHSGWGQIIDVKNLDSVTISVTSTFSSSLTTPELKVLCLYESEEIPVTMDSQKKMDYDNRHLTQVLNDTNKTYTRTINTRGFAKVYVLFTGGYKAEGQGTFDFTLHNIYVGEESTHHDYEPYKSNTTTFEQKDDKTIVLRSLPNGVCDTLNVETGEYIKRIGEKTFSGANNEGWIIANNGIKANTIAFGYSGLNGATRNTNVLCDTFIYPVGYPEDREGIQTQSGTQGQIYISIFTSKLSTPDAAGFKAWLQANPVTVQYELATPIVSTIDIQGFPYAYTNGHVQLSSGHSEQSLTPKVEYSVATNRNGQIRSNQKMVERHQKQLDQLQAIILANLVNSQYNQTLTTLKYELSRV